METTQEDGMRERNGEWDQDRDRGTGVGCGRLRGYLIEVLKLLNGHGDIDSNCFSY